MKTVDTLVADIEALFGGHSLTAANLDTFVSGLGADFLKKFEKYGEDRKTNLYLSNLGKPLRQLWYEIRSGLKGESLPAHKKLSFLYGDLLEDLLVLLALEAGHTVTDLQKEVEVDGVRGKIDCVIDGVLVDIKSASSRSFAKFKDGSIFEDDPFGYVAQLSGYSVALGGMPAGWFVVDKVLGHLVYVPLPPERIAAYDVRKRIADVRAMLDNPEKPECCCSPVADGRSGNERLPLTGAYCSWKRHCYPEMRTFLYSSGPVFLTTVKREPNVFEVRS